ncbi:MAG: DUF1800 domain-containing protein [Pyrinomonadaceae bacterium]|nr:DUF1800 domain-containing protein [Pyrinomonadaceae bacterium]
MSEEQRIVHVLNRLGFGARPGDVERVKAMGVERYIEQQFQPEAISDAAVEAKLRNLPALTMTTTELYAKYPQAGRLIRELQRRGEMPADLAAAVQSRQNATQQGNGAMTREGNAAAQTTNNAPNGATTQAMGNNPAATATGENEANKRDYRQAIREYMRQNNLQPPAVITAQLQASRILRAAHSERQLQEVLVDFWSNHFNIFANKGADKWLLPAYDRDTIRPHTLGKFRDLLTATAQSPAMLFYLDNFQSVSPNAQGGGRGGNRRQQMLQRTGRGAAMNNGALGGMRRNNRPGANRGMGQQAQAGRDGNMTQGQMTQQQPSPQQQAQRRRRGINENYARELMELHTLGVDGGYTQKDIVEIARCFTGWTINNPRGGGGMNDREAGTFTFNPRLHDDSEKTVLGVSIPSGGGIKDGLTVLDILARHPSTAKFIATKLSRRFVVDEPSPALVERVAAAFTKSDGDIRQTLRAIFTSPEFNAPENYRAKIKTPFEYAVSAIRAFGGETNGGPAIHQWIAKMGEPLYAYQAPTGYPDKAEAWVNTGALLERLNYALALTSNRIPNTRVNLERFAGSGAAGNNLTDADKRRMIDQFSSLLLRGDISEKTKAALLRQLSAPQTASAPAASAQNEPSEMEVAMRPPQQGGGGRRRNRDMTSAPVGDVSMMSRIAALIVGSPEFQRQ